ncbi:Uncharacterised protein [Helicobacter fennelliae]|uniref:Uncharacterized protein n=1 Tax=Helicobacter fennelliae TaxID=215 RepID=A0A2X3EJ14_9HELI|nr:hypothetical protein [Helicobacter fennelliae]SQC36503.1 Uncharacterised protein [Helicobacter fennelliae]
MKQEKRGIYNVTFNEKKATPILKDIELIQNAVIEYIAMYVRGYHNPNKDKGRGAEHIKLHLESGSEGEITIQELLNLGHSLREYLKNFNEPFIDNKGGKVFEWQNEENVRFRAIVARVSSGTDLPSYTHSNEQIISFYSDRNFNERMEFKNPKVKAYYENLHLQSQDAQIKVFRKRR